MVVIGYGTTTYKDATGSVVAITEKDFNDGQKDADELIKLFRQVPADLVNLIEYNPIGIDRFQKPDEKTTDAFRDYLQANRVNVHLRRSRGRDIDAACGQLANKG